MERSWCTPPGFTRGESNWNPSSLPIAYRINLASAPASIGMDGTRAAVEAGFASWAAPACTRWRATNAGTSTLTRARTGDTERTIVWISDAWPPEPGDVRSTIGVTTPVWRSGGYFIDADIQFNAVGFHWNMTGVSGVDTQSIATHEEGHFLGLNHSALGRAVMYASYSGGLKRALDADDVNGVCTIYPSGSSGDAGAPDDAGTMTGTGAVGDACSASQPCAAGNRCVCRSATDCFCSRGCSTSAPCPSGFTCAMTSLGSLCVPGRGSTAPGTRRTGDPCASGADCASGVCVRTSTSTFCSQVCTDDCACPDGYQCFPTSTGTTSVCAQGTNTCTPADDGGLTEVDAGGGETDAGPADAVADVARDGGTTPARSGCGCAVPATRQGMLPGIVELALGAAALAGRRRVAFGRTGRDAGTR